MKKTLFPLLVMFFCATAGLQAQTSSSANKALNNLFAAYHEESLKLSPLSATSIGDNRYNHLLPAEFTDSYQTNLKDYYNRYLTALIKYKRETLDQNDK